MDMRFEAKLFQSIKVLIYFSCIHTAAPRLRPLIILTLLFVLHIFQIKYEVSSELMWSASVPSPSSPLLENGATWCNPGWGCGSVSHKWSLLGEILWRLTRGLWNCWYKTSSHLCFVETEYHQPIVHLTSCNIAHPRSACCVRHVGQYWDCKLKSSFLHPILHYNDFLILCFR